jgi:hypothetical protein
MKINYHRLLELNKETLTDNGEEQLSCFYLIQNTVERFLYGEELNERQKLFLIELGVLIYTEDDNRKNIVEPFNFINNGSTNS